MRTTWLVRSLADTAKHTPVGRGIIPYSSTYTPRCGSRYCLPPRAYSYTSVRFSSSTALNETVCPPTIAIIGSGPAGFYTARHLQRHLPSPRIDIYDRLPVPFGLVRYGVAPDHPEVKKCIEDFEHVAQDENARFIGNVQLGENVQLKSLLRHYDVVVFAYGASKDRELGLEDEHMPGVLSARAFVGWYNGLPEYRDLNPDLSRGENAVIIGQGNVALDCARILLADVEELKKTDITSHALEILRNSKVRHVSVVGRRGPMQAAFTIKEVRELINLPNINFRCMADGLYPTDVGSLPRPKKRLMELLMKHRDQQKVDTQRSCTLRFCLAPIKLVRQQSDSDSNSNGSDSDSSLDGLTLIEFQKTILTDPSDPASKVHPTTATTALPATLLLRSIGYKAEALPGMPALGIQFDARKGMLVHDGVGRLDLLPPTASSPSASPPPNAALYCAGWVKRGPTGVIASTMTDAFQTAEAIVDDIKSGVVRVSSSQYQHPKTQVEEGNRARQTQVKQENRARGGWPAVKSETKAAGKEVEQIVDWKGWKMIDEVEKLRGRESGKPREKLVDVAGMVRQAAVRD